jgi:hypothetical protein
VTVTPSRYPPEKPERRHTSDTGPFVVIPVWVLELPISHLALRLYAIHADHADRSGAHYHGRKALAEQLGCSVDTLDRANEALVHHGALRIERRRDAQGDPTSNRYIIRRGRPGVAAPMRLPVAEQVRPGSQAGAATGGRTDAALSSKSIRNLNQSAGACATDVDGAPVDEPTPPPSFTLPPLSEQQRALNLAKVREIRSRGRDAS